jgi:resorcinol 4-hydroxylase (FADH2)
MAAAPSTRADLLARARALVPVLKSRAAAAERLRHVPGETIGAIREQGLFRVVQPARFGGFEQDYDLLIEIITILAEGCASSAWVYAIAAGQQWLAANLPLQAQEEFWGRDRDAVTCGSFPPVGVARAVAGGWRVSGRWDFCSGGDSAQGAILGTRLPPPDGAEPGEPHFFLVPARDIAIEDNWHAVGLAGTGSKIVVLDDAFVPSHRAMPVSRMAHCREKEDVAHAHPMYRLPILTCVPCCFAAVALGAAKGACADFVALTRERSTRGGVEGVKNPVSDFAGVQMRVGEALACVDAGETILLRDNRNAVAALREGRAYTLSDRVAVRRGHAFAARMADEAVNAVAGALGVSGLFADNPVHRAQRDVTAACRHIGVNWDAISALVGQHALGIEPKGNF